MLEHSELCVTSLQSLVHLLDPVWGMQKEAAFALAEISSSAFLETTSTIVCPAITALKVLLGYERKRWYPDSTLAATTLALIELCRHCPPNAATFFIKDDLDTETDYGGPVCSKAFNRLINSEAVAARCLPLLLAEQLLRSQEEAVEEWVSFLLKKLLKMKKIAEAVEDFKKGCLPLLIKLLDSKSENIRVSPPGMLHRVQS